MDRDDALDYPILYEKALAEIARLRNERWGACPEYHDMRAEIKRLLDLLEEAVDAGRYPNPYGALTDKGWPTRARKALGGQVEDGSG
jgi:hypothetical protein